MEEPRTVTGEAPELNLPELCQAIAEASPVPMTAVAGTGNIIRYANPAFCALARKPLMELTGLPFREIVPAGHECLELLDRVHRTAQAEFSTGDKDAADSFIWSYAMWPAVASDGRVGGIIIQITESTSAHQRKTAMNQALLIASLRQHEQAERAEAENVKLLAEIVERKNVEEELRRANRDLERFTSVASHDLQEPLRTVTAYTQLLARRLGPRLEPADHSLMNYIVEGSSRMGALITDLLTYARIGGEQSLQRGFVESGEALQAALDNLKGSIDEASGVVTTDPLPLVYGSFHQLTRVFQNLIGNALKYRTPQVAPKIHVSADQSNDEWIISVRDNGIGFKAEYGETIFGIFKRLHGSRYEGTGIGLAICKRIIELHGGRIWATSAEGAGATFFFTLPDVARTEEPSGGSD